MSAGPGRREVAHRVFAAEYDDADFEYSESDEERAPNYVVTPTGARVNRLFVVGVLTEVESVGEDVLRARVVDPTGAFVVYAGQYQPEAMAFLEDAAPPMFVAVTGKARTFSPDDSDVVYTSVRPESINEVDADTRDRWTVQAAEHTLGRVAAMDAAIETGLTGDELSSTLEAAGVAESLAAGIPVALDHYGTATEYLAGMADLATDALAVVADEMDEVEVPDLAPDAPGDRSVDRERLAAMTDLAVVDLSAEPTAGEPATEPESTPAPGSQSEAASPGGGDGSGATAGADTGAERGGEVGEADDDADAADPATGDPETSTVPAEASDASGGPSGAVEETQSAGDDSDADDIGDFGDSGDSEDDDDFESDDIGDFDDGDDIGDFDEGAGDVGEDDVADTTDTTADGTETAAADVDPEDPPEEVLDEEERERVKEEFGTDFQTGTEVGEPGEAGIEPEAGPIDPSETDAEDADEGAETSTAGTGAGGAAPDQADERATTEATADTEAVGDFETGEPTSGADEPDSAADADPDDEGTVPTGDAAESDEEAQSEEEASTEAVDLEDAVLTTMAELDDGGGADREELVETVVADHGVTAEAVEDAIESALMGGQCYEPDDGKLSAI